MLSHIVKRTFATSGHLLTWGQTTYGWGRPLTQNLYSPGFIGSFNDVVKVSTGQYHLGFITKDHTVYTTGLGDNGRLGHSDNREQQLPKRVSFDNPNTKFKDISCGTRHSLALTDSGQVYAWGYPGAIGQQGSKGTPVKIHQNHFQNDKVVAVSAANDFSAALCDQGHFYVWGEGLQNIPYWQVSLVPKQNQQVQQLLSKRHAKIVKFAAIDRFIILLLDNGRLYCRGINNGGVFGARTNPLVQSDLKLKKFAKVHDQLYKDQKIVDFQASSNSCIFRTQTDKIFYTGMNTVFQPQPFPYNVKAKKIFASQSSVAVLDQKDKLYFLNEQIIEDSDFVSKKDRVFVSEDANLKGLLQLGGTYNIRYAIVE